MSRFDGGKLVSDWEYRIAPYKDGFEIQRWRWIKTEQGWDEDEPGPGDYVSWHACRPLAERALAQLRDSP